MQNDSRPDDLLTQRIEELEADRDRMKARLDWIVLKCHWTSEQMHLGAYAAIDEEMRKDGKDG